jgi:peroxiredoxin
VSGRTRTFLAAAVAVLGAGLLWVLPVAAVAVTFVGWALALSSSSKHNEPTTRLAALVALLAHAATLARASGSPLLGAVAIAAQVSLPVYELSTRWLGYRQWILGACGIPVAVVLLAAGWPGPWGFAAIPSLAFATFVVTVVRRVALQLRAARNQWTLKVGDVAPDFRLATVGGPDFVLSEARGRNVLLNFLAGDWCPLCHVKMRVFQRELPLLEQNDVQLVVVVAAGAVMRELGPRILLLEDRDCAVARRYGIAYHATSSDQEVPLPVTVLIDREGVVRYACKPEETEVFIEPRVVVELIRGLPGASAAA